MPALEGFDEKPDLPVLDLRVVMPRVAHKKVDALARRHRT
eukprot:CAMPEP_0205918682 /NCGR_PEP_ID=MMETSP1325-20131115/9961_1 /ASSEMBLY_ACC=CAM_ASM_000708 /TAXON_ID=236786 /ORGANISM="Florenciella sp., Strain RCC1007" /LENGTH=39 /DNA_ID= /DNA_START= /DNA_END= /DNA_ORIENTATION=